MLELGSSTTKEKKGKVFLEVGLNQDFDVLLSFAFPFQPSLTRELKTMPQSCADRKLSTR